jgi:thiol:disulfide interchange protein
MYKYLTYRIGVKNSFYILMSISIVLATSLYMYKTLGIGKREGFDASTDGKKQAELMLFYADWCPACKQFKPTWHEFKESMSGKTINGYHVILTDVNCSDKNDSASSKKMTQMSVSGFPTVVLLKDGTKYKFDGKRTNDGLTQFLQENL